MHRARALRGRAGGLTDVLNTHHSDAHDWHNHMTTVAKKMSRLTL